MGSFDVSGPLLLLGTIFGLGYALLGIGLVLAYRSSGFINFAHGSIGLVAASMMSVVVNDYGVPYWVGFVGALIVAALLAAGIESFVVRKLATAPKVLSMVATLGAAEALLLLSLSFSKGGLGGGSFPQPPGFPRFELTVFVSPSATALLFLSPVVVGGLYLFLQRSRFGLAIRGAAANPDSATLAGVDPRHMAMLSWALAGAIAAFAAMLIIPNQSTVTADALGPDFIIRGLAVAALARFANLPIALLAGLGIGMVEQIMISNPEATGWFEIALFVLILAGVALQVRAGREQPERWSSLAPSRRLPDSYREVWLIRNLGWVVGGAAAVAAALVPLGISNRSAFVLSTVVAFATIGISVSFLTGLAGQLSLGQVAFAAIGAVAGVRVAVDTGSLVLGLLCGGAVGAVVSAAVGLPALRLRGLLLAIATLAFALATFSWLLRQDWAFGAGLSSRPASVFGIELTTSRGVLLCGAGRVRGGAGRRHRAAPILLRPLAGGGARQRGRRPSVADRPPAPPVAGLCLRRVRGRRGRRDPGHEQHLRHPQHLHPQRQHQRGVAGRHRRPLRAHRPPVRRGLSHRRPRVLRSRALRVGRIKRRLADLDPGAAPGVPRTAGNNSAQFNRSDCPTAGHRSGFSPK